MRGRCVHSLIAVLTLAAIIPPVALESPAGAYALALADLRTLPITTRYTTRYLSLYSISPADRADLLKALAFWANSLSWRREPVAVFLTGDGLLARLDIEALGWDRRSRAERVAELVRLGVAFAPGDISDDPWETLARRDRYFNVNSIRNGKLYRGWLDPAVEESVRLQTYSLKAVLRADWFLVQTSIDRPNGSYSDFLILPKRESDLYRSLLIDERNVRALSLSVGGATKAGISFVALNPRELELLRGPYGDLWRTYDFDSNNIINDVNGKRNPRRTFRGTVTHDGREIIWELPNGLHAYYLANGAGIQVAEVPPQIAQDQRRDLLIENRRIAERVVKNAWKCVDCHGPESGIIPFKDTVTDQMLARSSGLLAYGADPHTVAREKRLLEDYYREHYEPRMATGRQSYEASVVRIGGLSGKANAVNFVKWVEWYAYGTVGRVQAARELGLVDAPPEVVSEFLRQSGDPDLLFLIDDEPITRAQLELSFRAGMNGVPAFPWEDRPGQKQGH